MNGDPEIADLAMNGAPDKIIVGGFEIDISGEVDFDDLDSRCKRVGHGNQTDSHDQTSKSNSD